MAYRSWDYISPYFKMNRKVAGFGLQHTNVVTLHKQIFLQLLK